MFEHLRRSLDELLLRATRPEDRRDAISRMRGTLVQAKVGVDDLRDALASTRRRLEGEQKELATVRRRRELAQQINDAETVSVAERFERQHDERVRVLTEKIAVQTRELELADRELEDMKVELRRAMDGIPPAASRAPLDDPLTETEDARAREELDAILRARARTDRDADVDRRLEELKKQMGK